MQQKITTISSETIQNKIFLIRGKRVMLDRDLAELYGVPTKRLNEQVKRNKKRFPEHFMFQLTKTEKDEVVANCDHLKTLKFSPTLPHAFTEHGVAMLSSVLNSEKAIQVNIQIINAFIKMRQMLANQEEIREKIEEIQRKYSQHSRHLEKHDSQLYFHSVLLEGLIEDMKKINKLLSPPEAEEPKKTIGFRDKK